MLECRTFKVVSLYFSLREWRLMTLCYLSKCFHHAGDVTQDLW